MIQKFSTKPVCSLLLVAALTGCGGGSNNTTTTVPDSNSEQENQSPTVNAGDDQQVNELAQVSLQGQASDSDGTIASYQWTQTSGTSVELSNTDQAQITFSAPSVEVDETLTFELTVTDNDGASASDSVNIQVTDVPPIPPVANAGADQNVTDEQMVTLNATASTEGNSPILSYHWSQLDGTRVIMEQSDNAEVSFELPVIHTDETMTFKVTIEDANGETSSDMVLVNVAHNNLPPTINAGKDLSVLSGRDSFCFAATFNADGVIDAAYDLDGSVVSVEYEQLQGTELTLFKNSGSLGEYNICGIIPDSDIDETLLFRLTAIDDKGTSTYDDVEVTLVGNTTKMGPIANAGTPQYVAINTPVTLTGKLYQNQNGRPVSYQWEQVSGPAVNLENANTKTANFIVDSLQEDMAELIFKFTATDDQGLSTSDKVTVKLYAQSDAVAFLPIDSHVKRCLQEHSNAYHWINPEDFKQINCNSHTISKFDGMEKFTNLTHIVLGRSVFKELDLSYASQLVQLDLVYQYNVDDYNRLTSLDLSHNQALQKLTIEGLGLGELVINNNPELIQLHLDNNWLETINVDINNKLTELFIRDNQLTDDSKSYLDNINGRPGDNGEVLKVLY